MRKILYVLGLLALVCAGNALAQGDPQKGQANYAVCVACHGQNGEGNQVLNSPSIAGQEYWYVVRQLKNFKEGLRGTDPKDLFGMQMRPMAMTLATDADVENVAAYVSKMKPIKPESTLTGGNAEKGKTTYTTICATCHGPEGKGLQAMNAPNNTIQQDWYLLRQLQNFKEGIRGTNPKDIFGMQMRPMAMTLADEQAMKDVIAYIESLGK